MKTNIFNFVKQLSQYIHNGYLNFINSDYEEYKGSREKVPSYKIELSEAIRIIYEFSQLINYTNRIKLEAVTHDGENYNRQILQEISNQNNISTFFANIALRKFYVNDPTMIESKFSNIKLTFNSDGPILGLDMYMSKELISACTIHIKDQEAVSCLNLDKMDIVNELLSFPVTPYIEISDSLATLLKIEPSN